MIRGLQWGLISQILTRNAAHFLDYHKSALSALRPCINDPGIAFRRLCLGAFHQSGLECSGPVDKLEGSSSSCNELDSKERKRNLIAFEGHIDYLQTTKEVIDWCREVKDVWSFGFDGEWDKMAPSQENEEPIALLQFAYTLHSRIRVALIHVSKLKQAAISELEEDVSGIPPPLKSLLEDRGKHKAGCSLFADSARLATLHGVTLRGLVDLDPGPANRGIKKMLYMLFQVKLDRDASIAKSTWSGELTPEQQKFAANNAYAALLIFRCIRDGSESPLWKRLGLCPDPIVGAMLGDDVRVLRIKGW